jgi:hypothetical protein
MLCVKEFVCDGKTKNFFPFQTMLFNVNLVLLLADISSSGFWTLSKPLIFNLT